MTTVTDETSIQKAEGLEALTPQKANEVLSTLFSSSTIPLSIDPNLSTRSKVVVISGTNKECRAEVHLDIDNVKVVTSDVFYTGLMDVFLVYTHSSDSTTKSGNRINFTVKGEVLIRIIWQGIELKRVPVTMEGYYDIDKGSGSLTFF